MKRTFSLRLFVLLLLTVVLSACEQASDIQPSGKIVKIGFIGPYTGTDQAKGRESIKGIRAAMHLQPLLDNGDAV